MKHILLINCLLIMLERSYELDDYWLFGSKTVYNEVSGKNMSIDIEGCKPIQLIMLISNGTTSPSNEFIRFRLSSLGYWKSKINIDKATLSEEDVNAILNWEQRIKADSETELNKRSTDDLNEIGTNVKKTFATLFEDEYNQDKIKIHAADFKLSKKSAKLFMKAVFNDDDSIYVTTCDKNDYMLMLNAYKRNEDPNYERYNKYAEEEVRKFRISNPMWMTIGKIKTKMGLERLSYEDIIEMYESCRYERSFDPSSIPPWCRVFDKDDLEVMEYNEDLYWYYYIGRGNPFNRRASSLILRNISDTLINMSEKQGVKSLFYMVPKENLMNLLVNMGVFDNDPYLTYSEFENVKNRKFKASKYIPWTANIMIVSSLCNNDEQYVSFFVNENPMTLQMYNGRTCHVCPLNDVIHSI